MAKKKPIVLYNGSLGELQSSDTVMETVYFVQDTPDTIWYITHNLNKRPSITVYDSTHRVVIPDVVNATTTTVELHFSAATGGYAYLS
jgi:hypothetical protein